MHACEAARVYEIGAIADRARAARLMVLAWRRRTRHDGCRRPAAVRRFHRVLERGTRRARWPTPRIVHEPASLHALPVSQRAPAFAFVAPWNSPPPFLLIMTPLALLPYPVAALLFLAGTAALYLFAARKLLPDARALLFAATLPAALYHLGTVQTGLLVAGSHRPCALLARQAPASCRRARRASGDQAASGDPVADLSRADRTLARVRRGGDRNCSCSLLAAVWCSVSISMCSFFENLAPAQALITELRARRRRPMRASTPICSP